MASIQRIGADSLQALPPLVDNFTTLNVKMKTTLKFVSIALLLLGIMLAAFQWGRSVGVSSANLSFRRIENRLTNLNALAAHGTNVKISEHLSADKRVQAKCLADLLASAYARQVRSCLADQQCRPLVVDEVTSEAPELLGSTNERFRYYEERESCLTGQ